MSQLAASWADEDYGAEQPTAESTEPASPAPGGEELPPAEAPVPPARKNGEGDAAAAAAAAAVAGGAAEGEGMSDTAVLHSEEPTAAGSGTKEVGGHQAERDMRRYRCCCSATHYTPMILCTLYGYCCVHCY